MKTLLAVIAVVAVIGLLACRPIVIQTGPSAEPPQQATQPEPGSGPERAPSPEPPTAVSAALSGQPERSAESPASSEPARAAPEKPSAKADGEKKKHGKPPKVERGPKAAPPAETAAETPAPSPAEPAAATSPEPAPSDQRIVQRIEVRVEGSTTGVVARIDRVDPQDQRAYFARTRESGVAEPGAPCKLGDRFDVKPQIPIYLGVDMEPCAATIVFEVPSANAVHALSSLGDEAMKQGQPGLAHVYYAAAAKRLSKVDPQAAGEALAKANRAAAEALGVPGESKKLNRKAIEALRDYQRKSNLPVTGKLDAPTQEKLSGIDEAEAMKRANAVPQEKLRDDEKDKGLAPEEKKTPERLEPERHRLRLEPPRTQKTPEGGTLQRPRNDTTPALRPKLAPGR